MIGPFCGLTKGMVSRADGRSASVCIAPPKASMVSTITRSPGRMCSTGSEYGPMVKWNVPWTSSVRWWVSPGWPPATPRGAMIELVSQSISGL